MRLLTLAAGILASVVGVQAEIEGPFYLSFVRPNGTVYPATMATVSRGALILSGSDQYTQQWEFDPSGKVIYPDDDPDVVNSSLGPGSLVLFTRFADPGAELDQIQSGNHTYLIKAGGTAGDLFGWNSSPTTADSPNNVFWVGGNSTRANSKLRIDTHKPWYGH